MLRRIFVILCLCGGLVVAPAAADAAPLSLENDVAFAPGVAKKLGAAKKLGGGSIQAFGAADGYNLISGTPWVDRRNYTVRLVASGLANIENVRADAQAAAAQIQGTNGVSIIIAPGTLAAWQPPAPGEIMMSVATSSVCGSSTNAVGCTTYYGISQSGITSTIDSASITIAPTVVNATIYSTALRRNVVHHELGHAMGLDHFNGGFNGATQVMESTATSVSSYQQGDRNGLAFVGRPRDSDGDGVIDTNDWCLFRVGVASNHGCQPEGQQSSSAVYRENIDNVFMFYPQTNGVLGMEYMNASSPGSWVFGQFAGTAVVGPTSSIHRANGDVMSFYRGTDSSIHVTWLNHNTNLWQTTGAMTGPAAGPPSAVERNNGDVHVFYKGTDGALHDLWLSGTTWNDQWMGGSPAGQPAVMNRTSNGELHVFYRTTSGLIYDLWLSGSTWNNQYLGGAPVTDPKPLYRPDTGDVHVFYKATDGALYDLWLGGSTWHNQILGGTPAGDAAPLYSTRNGNLHAFYRSTSGNLRDWWMDAQTNIWHDDQIGGSMAGTPSPVNRTKNGDLHVFYVRSNGNLNDAVYTSVWTDTFITTGAAVPTG